MGTEVRTLIEYDGLNDEQIEILQSQAGKFDCHVIPASPTKGVLGIESMDQVVVTIILPFLSSLTAGFVEAIGKDLWDSILVSAKNLIAQKDKNKKFVYEIIIQDQAGGRKINVCFEGERGDLIFRYLEEWGEMIPQVIKHMNEQGLSWVTFDNSSIEKEKWVNAHAKSSSGDEIDLIIN